MAKRPVNCSAFAFWAMRFMPCHGKVIPSAAPVGLASAVKGVLGRLMSLRVWPPKRSTFACALVAAIATVGACWLLVGTSEAGVPQYQRRSAAQAACRDVAAELARRLDSPLTFVDDCRRPTVTPLSNRPGLLIVSRVVDVQIGRDTTRRTYSTLMDGRHPGAWRVIGVESAPNDLSITQLAKR